MFCPPARPGGQPWGCYQLLCSKTATQGRAFCNLPARPAGRAALGMLPTSSSTQATEIGITKEKRSLSCSLPFPSGRAGAFVVTTLFHSTALPPHRQVAKVLSLCAPGKQFWEAILGSNSGKQFWAQVVKSRTPRIIIHYTYSSFGPCRVLSHWPALLKSQSLKSTCWLCLKMRNVCGSVSAVLIGLPVNGSHVWMRICSVARCF